jgi:signal transduction histidine kinase
MQKQRDLIAKWIVEDHRGHILAENYATAAPFRFTLPTNNSSAQVATEVSAA